MRVRTPPLALYGLHVPLAHGLKYYEIRLVP
jgi:hypothetical protein